MSRYDMYGAYLSGKPIKDIANIIGASESLVRYWVKKIGNEDKELYLRCKKIKRLLKIKGFHDVSRSEKVQLYLKK